MQAANSMLQQIGKGVNLDMTEVVEKQVRQMLARLKSEIEHGSKNAGKGFTHIADHVKIAESRITELISTTRRMTTDGSILDTAKGYDGLNRSITETAKNGELLSRVVKFDSA